MAAICAFHVKWLIEDFYADGNSAAQGLSWRKGKLFIGDALVDLFPLLFISIVLLAALLRNKNRPIIQIYLTFTFCYLNLFPAVSQILSADPARQFVWAQWIAILFFQLPLFAFLSRKENGEVFMPGQEKLTNGALMPIVPWILLALLTIFWAVALAFDHFFVRLQYSAFQENPNSVPALLLFPYRITIEGSYFIILYLAFSLRLSSKTTRHRNVYNFAFWMYLFTFIAFFFVNSRMQFLLLLLCLYFIRPRFMLPKIRLGKTIAFSLAGMALIIALTLIRELLIESNERLGIGDASSVFYTLGSMISDRLNSLMMFTRVLDDGYNPFGVQPSGLLHLCNLYFSFFAEPEVFAQIRASEITSPSVEVINRLLGESYVDFPKSMVLDIQLTFGSLALPILAWLLAAGIRFSQVTINRSTNINQPLLVALFLLPLLLQFEKEFFGFLTMLLKLSPLLVLLLVFQNRARAGRPVRPSRSLLSGPQSAPND